MKKGPTEIVKRSIDFRFMKIYKNSENVTFLFRITKRIRKYIFSKLSIGTC